MDDLVQRLGAAILGDGDDESSSATSQIITDRSTWAEVVSGHDSEKQGNKHEQGQIHGHRKEEVKSSYDYDDRIPQQKHQHNFSSKVSDTPEGWETVGRRNRRSEKTYHQVSSSLSQSFKRPPDEQEYADAAYVNTDLEPTQNELHDLSKACNKLWELDFNCLVPGQDYEIDCGEGKRSRDEGDMAENTLFSWVKEDVFRRPTYARFFALLDNYNAFQTSQEVVTNEEKREEAAFIEEISRTAPIKYLHKYLCAKGILSDDYASFKRRLKSLWFDFFSRHGVRDSSCAFEHVFVGEVKPRAVKEVSGFHNWIQIYLEEAKRKIDYKGYIFPRRRGSHPDFESRLLTIQFTWNGILKPTCSTFIGVSPEFEVALYTLCFYAGSEDNYIELGPYDVNIKCYVFEHERQPAIGSIFPIALN